MLDGNGESHPRQWALTEAFFVSRKSSPTPQPDIYIFPSVKNKINERVLA